MIKHYRHLLLAFLLLCNTAIIQAQNITLNLKNVTVKEAIEAVKEQTGKSFFFNVNDVDLNRRITVELKDATLGDALTQILQGQEIAYEVKENHIVLSKKDEKKPRPSARITGQVTDESGTPLIGVNITAKTGVTSVTDIDGNYSIQAAPGTTITFSYIGFLSQKVRVNDQRNINIQLVEDTKALNEVVVIGYGTQKKANLTGAVDAISSKEIEDRPVANLGRALQGAVPNLNIFYGSGRPNEDDNNSINIRGFGSINEEAKPLVLIDGVEGNIDNINPRDVESISVLKDASSAAIYGARAAFGVILITTKKGETGDAKVNYNGRFSFSGSTIRTDFITSGYDAAMLVDEFFRSYNGTPYTKYTAEDYAELEARRYDKVENPDRPWTVVKNVGGIDRYMYYANFDWYNYLISHTRPTWDNNVSISGGTQKMNYFISANYHTEKGIYKQNADRYNTANIRARISGDIKDWFNLTVTTHLYHSQYKAPGLEDGFNIPNYTFHALPFLMPYNPDGTWVFSTPVIAQQPTDGVHIMTGEGTTFTNDKNKRLTTTVNAIFKLYKGLTFHANYSFRYDTQDKVVRTSLAEYSTQPGVIETCTGDLFKNKLRQRSNSEYYHMIDAYFSYDNTFNDHHVWGVLGFDYEQDYQKNLYSTMLNIQSNELNDFNLGDHSKDVYLEGGQYEWALESFFGRAGYDWKGRYLAEVNMRWDASSRFRPDKRAAVFPSVSAAWRMSEEPFFEPIRNTFSNLKIRGSYGSLGNQAVSSPYPYIQTLNLVQQNYLVNGEFLTYASVSAPTSGDFTWETVIHKNLGLDLGFFNNRLSFTGDVYIRDTKDMLVPGKALPSTYGASSPRENAADLRTKGYELTISWNDKFNLAGKPFTYGVSFALGDNISKITKYDNPTKDFNVSSYYEGMTIGEIWGYSIDGLFQTDEEAAAYQEQIDHSLIAKNILQTAVGEYKGLKAGDPRFVDLDGNGRIDDGKKTADDRGDMRIIGNSRPRYNFGGNINFGWNGFDFSAFFQGIGRQHVYPGPNAMLFWGGFARPYSSFTPVDFLDDVWSEDNPDAYLPKIRGYAAQGDRHLAYVNDRYLQNLAYCRLKNLTFGYTLPQSLTQKAKIDRVRVYFSGDNLFTWTTLKTKYVDPEQFAADGDARVYPYAKTFSFGIDITF